MSSPLFDTLFRPTTAPRPAADRTAADRTVADQRTAPPADTAGTPASRSAAAPAIASAAPVRTTGTRTRAGNAMTRTRAALLSGAAQAVCASGTKIAMSQVAVAAGVAKATLYNHFRTRDAVLAFLLAHEVTVLVEAVVDAPLEQALADTALAISRHPVRQGLAAVEPAALARLATIDDTSEGWRLARTAVSEQLTRSGRGGGAELVLRWLGSFLLTPASPTAIDADVAVLVAGLPAVPGAGGFGPDAAGARSA